MGSFSRSFAPAVARACGSQTYRVRPEGASLISPEKTHMRLGSGPSAPGATRADGSLPLQTYPVTGTTTRFFAARTVMVAEEVAFAAPVALTVVVIVAFRARTPMGRSTTA